MSKNRKVAKLHTLDNFVWTISIYNIDHKNKYSLWLGLWRNVNAENCIYRENPIILQLVAMKLPFSHYSVFLNEADSNFT